jgi:hypothetical protein
MCSVKYELGFYIPLDDILHSYPRKYLGSYILPLSYINVNIVGSVLN